MNIWIQRAEIFDSWRVVPRTLVFGYVAFTAHVINYLLIWYTHLPAAQQTAQNAGLFTAVGAILTGFGVPIFSIYSNSGRDWNAAQISTLETTTTTKSSTP